MKEILTLLALTSLLNTQVFSTPEEELEELKTYNELQDAKLEKEQFELKRKKSQLELKQSLQELEFEGKLEELNTEKKRLEIESQLKKAKQEAELADIKHKKEKLALEYELMQQQSKKVLAELQLEKNKLSLENSKLSELKKKQEMELREMQDKIRLEQSKIDLENRKLQLEKTKHETELTRLKSDLDFRTEKKKWEDEVNNEIEYIENPLKDETLIISDRRIELNGAIIRGTADYVTRRIHYFNNKSDEAPIFIVIDTSPGGSVMEGYRILKAMDASRAPVHVAVKSYAASMAAVILTLADHSYAYPNAIILHHQPWSFSVGNITQQSEQMEIFREWAERLHEPVAEKMGVDLDKFYERMYKENSEGDWEEFANEAKELKWVDHIVHEIREEGIIKKPSDSAPKPRYFYFAEKDSQDQKEIRAKANYTELPYLEPFDFYFIHNPNNRYRW